MFTSYDKLVLHNYNSYCPKGFEFFITVLVLLLFVFFTYTWLDELSQMLNWSTEDWLQWLDNVWEKIKNEPAVILRVVLFLVPFLHLVYLYMALHRERFFLTSSGIQYQSPMPFFLQWLKPDWSIKWSMIKTAYFKPAKLGRGLQFEAKV